MDDEKEKPLVDQMTDVVADAAGELAKTAVKAVAKQAKKAVVRHTPTPVKKAAKAASKAAKAPNKKKAAKKVAKKAKKTAKKSPVKKKAKIIFPQVDGLGHSETAKHYAIKSRDEAVAYLATPALGARLLECTKLALAITDKSAHDIFGSPDDMKFHSSMTLFDAVDGGDLYATALDRCYGGKRDTAPVDILKQWSHLVVP